MKEIEILVQIVDGNIRDILNKFDKFESVGVKAVKDIYFYDPLRVDLLPLIDQDYKVLNSFRVRQKDNTNYLTYKVDKYDGETWLYSDEHETKVNNYETVVQIVKLLGLKELVTIENTKYTYLTEEFEIVLEDVKQLGLFLEVEYRHETSEEYALEVKKQIEIFINSLGITVVPSSNRGKPELMLKKIGWKK